MSTPALIALFLCILIGFVCMIVAAGGYRRGWSQPVWFGFTVAAFVFLTIIPVLAALTIGINPSLVTGD